MTVQNVSFLQVGGIAHSHCFCAANRFFRQIILSDAIKERAFVNKQHILDIFKGFKEYTQLKETRRRKQHFSEVIQDVGLFRFANDDQEFEMPFPPRKRSLFPKNVQRLPVRSQTQSCSLLLTVVGGKNVPCQINAISRQQKMANGGDDNLLLGATELLASVVDDEEEAYLGVMIRIKFRGKTYQTKVVSGTMSPQWKETIRVPLHDMLEDNFPIPPVLLQEEDIDITLFDCTNVDLRHMGGFYDDEETRTTEFRYLVSASL